MSVGSCRIYRCVSIYPFLIRDRIAVLIVTRVIACEQRARSEISLSSLDTVIPSSSLNTEYTVDSDGVQFSMSI